MRIPNDHPRVADIEKVEKAVLAIIIKNHKSPKELSEKMLQ